MEMGEGGEDGKRELGGLKETAGERENDKLHPKRRDVRGGGMALGEEREKKKNKRATCHSPSLHRIASLSSSFLS